jgi:hypothetical protein
MEKMNLLEDASEICLLAITNYQNDTFADAVQEVHDYLIDITGNLRDKVVQLEDKLAAKQCCCAD